MSDSLLVTGGCGFIGANLVPKLLAKGAHVRVLDNMSLGSVANLEGAEVDVMEGGTGELARTLAEIAGRPDHPIRYELARKGEVGRDFASFERARQTLGFSPRLSLREGLEGTWRWFTQQQAAVVVAEASNA